MRSRARFTAESIVLALSICFLGSGPLFAQGKSAVASKPDLWLDSRTPLSLTDLTTLLRQIQNKATANDLRLTEGIRRRRVDFPLTPENEELLRNLGATSQLIAVISTVAPPAPPRPTPTGLLTVRCAPAECEVFLKGTFAGSTESGQFTAQNLAVERFLVNLMKPGYIGQERAIDVEANRTTAVEVELEPDSGTKAGFGKQLLSAMLQQIGIGVRSGIPLSFTGEGSVIAWTADGKLSDWDFKENFIAGQHAAFDLRGDAKSVLELRCTGERCVPKGKVKKLDQAADDIGTTLKVLLRYQFTAMLERILSDRLSPSARSADFNRTKERKLRLEDGDDALEIVLGPDLLPLRITSERKGLDSGILVTYAHFVKLGEIRYPLDTEIKLLPDAPQHGIAIKLNRVTQGSKMKEKDFPK